LIQSNKLLILKDSQNLVAKAIQFRTNNLRTPESALHGEVASIYLERLPFQETHWNLRMAILAISVGERKDLAISPADKRERKVEGAVGVLG
jgi:hypothetical protein